MPDDVDELIDQQEGVSEGGKDTAENPPVEPATDDKSELTQAVAQEVEPAPIPTMVQEAAASVPAASPIHKALANPAANDKLLETIRRDDSSTSTLNAVMEEIAEEAAYIKAWRNKVWNGEEDISEATLNRIKMLRELVTAIVEKERLKREKAIGKVDFHSENFQNVLKMFMSIIMTTFKKVNIPSQFEDIFFTQLAKDFDGFEKKAEKVYYGKK